MKFIILASVFLSMSVLGHSGRTNSSGCHNEKETGGYHCHRSDTDKPVIIRGPASEEKSANKNKIETNTIPSTQE